MATDLNKVVTVGYLQSYDRLIKQAYKSADNTLKTDLLTEIGKINSFEITIVTELPTTGVTGTFYLIKAAEGEYNGAQNVYKEYLWYKKKDAVEADPENGIVASDAEYDWELVGDTKLDLDELKDDVDTECIKSIAVTHSTEIIEGTTIAVTTYTVSYKNGKGEEIDTEVFSAVTGVGDAIAFVPSDPDNGTPETGASGLMSANDKAVLDKLNSEMGDYISEAEADAKYVASAELGAYTDVTTGTETIHTATVTLSSADATALDTFDVKYATYADAVSAGEGTNAVGGLMSGSDKAKLDGINVTTDTDVDAWFDSNWPEETGG